VMGRDDAGSGMVAGPAAVELEEAGPGVVEPYTAWCRYGVRNSLAELNAPSIIKYVNASRNVLSCLNFHVVLV
jgi:hypothetical protein